MKVINILLALFLVLIFTGCSKEEEYSDLKFKTISEVQNISQDKLTVLFFSKPGCPWCAKQKEDFRTKSYISTFPQYDFVKIESNEKIYKDFSKIRGFKVTSYPTMYLIQRNNQELITLEKLEGYSNPSIFEPILEFNKDLLDKK